MSEPRRPPIFILGAPRSGTTLLRLMLDSHPCISCGPETIFFTDMRSIFDRAWSHLELYGFPREYWRERMAEFLDAPLRAYAGKRGKPRWAEKTPQYTLHVGFLAEVFPDAQFIHILRDGRDVVASHLARWGFRSAWCSVDVWRSSINHARRFGVEALPARYLEVRYEDLVRSPKPTMRTLLEFLGEPWDDAVLRYETASHDIQPTYAEHTRQRREESGAQAAVYESRIGAWRRELGWILRLRLRWRAGALLKSLGYTESPDRRARNAGAGENDVGFARCRDNVVAFNKRPHMCAKMCK